VMGVDIPLGHPAPNPQGGYTHRVSPNQIWHGYVGIPKCSWVGLRVYPWVDALGIRQYPWVVRVFNPWVRLGFKS
jgi:hypothetical protein